MGNIVGTDASSPTENAAYVLIGEIGPARGLRGEVFLRSFSDNPRRFASGAQVLVGPDPHIAETMIVEAVKAGHGKNGGDKKIVKFTAVSGRAQAETLKGRLVFATATETAPCGKGEFWEHQLIGLEVFDTTGRRLGSIEAVLYRPAQDLWQVASSSGPVLVPAVNQIVVSVDPGAGKVVLDPPEGLFE